MYHVLCNIVISSLVHYVRPDDGLIEKGPKHVFYLLTPYTLIKFCCVFTYLPYINSDKLYMECTKKSVYVHYPL